MEMEISEKVKVGIKAMQKIVIDIVNKKINQIVITIFSTEN